MPHESLNCMVRCPYYRSHARLTLHCLWLGGGAVTQRFASAHRRIRHMRRFCSSYQFGRCPMAAVMNNAYAAWLRPAEMGDPPAYKADDPDKFAMEDGITAGEDDADVDTHQQLDFDEEAFARMVDKKLSKEKASKRY